MKIIFTKLEGKNDRITCIRSDETQTAALIPKQGILPHDYFHLVVEKTLNWKKGFFSNIDNGMPIDPLELHIIKYDWSRDTQSLQSESLVECLQAMMWGGDVSIDEFMRILAVTCDQRSVPVPLFSESELTEIISQLKAGDKVWSSLSVGQSVTEDFEFLS